MRRHIFTEWWIRQSYRFCRGMVRSPGGTSISGNHRLDPILQHVFQSLGLWFCSGSRRRSRFPKLQYILLTCTIEIRTTSSLFDLKPSSPPRSPIFLSLTLSGLHPQSTITFISPSIRRPDFTIQDAETLVSRTPLHHFFRYFYMSPCPYKRHTLSCIASKWYIHVD